MSASHVFSLSLSLIFLVYIFHEIFVLVFSFTHSFLHVYYSLFSFFFSKIFRVALQWDHSKCVLTNYARSLQLPLHQHSRWCSGTFLPAIVGWKKKKIKWIKISKFYKWRTHRLRHTTSTIFGERAIYERLFKKKKIVVFIIFIVLRTATPIYPSIRFWSKRKTRYAQFKKCELLYDQFKCHLIACVSVNGQVAGNLSLP